MTQYIDKSTLAAELEKQIEFGKFKCQQSQENNDQVSYITWSEHIATCGKILCFLDTLEVKEFNSESASFDATVCKLGSIYLKEMDKDAIVKALEPYNDGDKVKVIIKARKGK